MKQFYETYAENEKLASLGRELSWTHNRAIFSRYKTDDERAFYLHLTAKNYLSVRELERQIGSGAFERAMLAEGKLSETIKNLRSVYNLYRWASSVIHLSIDFM